MKTFADYFTESARTHKFVVKFAIKPAEDQVLRIESRLKSYGLREMTAPVMVNDETKDFIGIKNRNVHSMDVVLERPATQYMLLQDLQAACGISESLLAVRSANEPIEIYSQRDVWARETNAKAQEDGFEPAGVCAILRISCISFSLSTTFLKSALLITISPADTFKSKDILLPRHYFHTNTKIWILK
jgi:hypothetical protein